MAKKNFVEVPLCIFVTLNILTFTPFLFSLFWLYDEYVDNLRYFFNWIVDVSKESEKVKYKKKNDHKKKIQKQKKIKSKSEKEREAQR